MKTLKLYLEADKKVKELAVASKEAVAKRLELARLVNADLEAKGVDVYKDEDTNVLVEKAFITRTTINQAQLKADNPAVYEKFVSSKFDESAFKKSEEGKALLKTNLEYFESTRKQASTLIKAKEIKEAELDSTPLLVVAKDENIEL